ncbi:MAG: hypothetical protein P8X51_18225, partial [Maritimibacter sp.]
MIIIAVFCQISTPQINTHSPNLPKAHFSALGCIMNTRTKIFATMGAALLLAWGALGGSVSGLQSVSGEAQQSATEIETVSTSNVPLLTTIKDLKIDVIQVQQWLSDIAATRASAGYDDGFNQAAAFAE